MSSAKGNKRRGHCSSIVQFGLRNQSSSGECLLAPGSARFIERSLKLALIVIIYDTELRTNVKIPSAVHGGPQLLDIQDIYRVRVESIGLLYKSQRFCDLASS